MCFKTDGVLTISEDLNLFPKIFEDSLGLKRPHEHN